jgi:hypothetical protein
VIAGTATEVSGRVRRRQENRWAQEEAEQYAQQQPAAPAPEAAPSAGAGSSKIEQLKQLGELKESGVLTDQEFAEQKAKLLAD